MDSKDILVIGNGPSAVSFVEQIYDSHNVTMISPGEIKDDAYFGKIRPCNSSSPWKFSTQTGSETSINLSDKFFQYEYKGPGGLSNSWGAGCSKLNYNDLGLKPEFLKQLEPYYSICEERVGLISHGSDSLDSYLGSFKKTGHAVKINPRFNFKNMSGDRLRLGYTRQAITTVNKSPNRMACPDCCGNFIHCKNGSVYNARNVLKDLKNKINLIENATAIKILSIDNGYSVTYEKNKKEELIKSCVLIIAAGTIESSKLIYSLLSSKDKKYKNLSLKLNHNPMTRLFFLSFKKSRVNNFPAGQIVGEIIYNQNNSFYLSLVDGISVPTSDILLNSPIKNKIVYNLINYIKKYLVFGFIFFPSIFSNSKINICPNSFMISHNENNNSLIRYSRKVVRKNFYKNNLILMPKILSKMLPGSDLHLGSTFPMGSKKYLNVSENCELNGMSNLFIIDGSWMPFIPEKPHTFTLMANAIRVADYIKKRF